VLVRDLGLVAAHIGREPARMQPHPV